MFGIDTPRMIVFGLVFKFPHLVDFIRFHGSPQNASWVIVIRAYLVSTVRSEITFFDISGF